ncbi:DUF7002 family protein [Lentzea nigeriaca]|uniref:DUF7002 family protein n=1 Tax=Lentzea nigeriaca TaxID=1128665 RepID=UPI0035573AE0
MYHMAEDGTWPTIQRHGLLSTAALLDLFEADAPTRATVLDQVRRSTITLEHPEHGSAVVRDQRPLKFLDRCLTPRTTPQQFLDALNGRVFFWLTYERLQRLLNASLYRKHPQTVLHIDTASLLAEHRDEVQLAPYNTGSMHVPTAPPRGADVFVDLLDYPYDRWERTRGRNADAVVELTVPHSVPRITDHTVRVERWHLGEPREVLYSR